MFQFQYESGVKERDPTDRPALHADPEIYILCAFGCKNKHFVVITVIISYLACEEY